MALAQTEGSTSRVDFGLDIGLLRSSGHPSWLEGSAGKLRFDEDNDGLQLTRGFLDFESLVTDTVKAHFLMEAYNDEFSTLFDITEAYLEWRPMPRSANRYRVKLGAFYPRIGRSLAGS